MSRAERFALLPASEQAKYLATLTEEQLVRLTHEWDFLARPSQLPPDGIWQVWLLLAGRGFGKTRVGAEMVNKWAEDFPYIALVGRTAKDVRDVMIRGEAGVEACAKPWFRPKYYPGKSQVIWPNGAIAYTYSADQPESLRGPSFNKAWSDEIAAWRRPSAWDNLKLATRLSPNPQHVVTTTPKNTKLIRELIKLAEDLDEIEGRMDKDLIQKKLEQRGGNSVKMPHLRVRITGGSSYENFANLAESFIQNIIAQYIGTRLEQQEIYARLLLDDPNAMWKRDKIEEMRIDNPPPQQRMCVAVDPSGSVEEGAAECGLILAGMGEDGHGYVLADYSDILSPAQWGRRALDLYYESQANAIVAEKNYGGLMVDHTIRSMVRPGEDQPHIELVTAARGKDIRADPIAARANKDPGEIHHVGTFPELEDELCTWVPGEKSPNRLDALVWAFYWLLIRPQEKRLGIDYGIDVTGRA